MADALEVSASGYADHLNKEERLRNRPDWAFGEKLKAIFEGSRKTDGLSLLESALCDRGMGYGRSRSARLPRRIGLHPVWKRRFQPQTTQSDSDIPVTSNWLGKIAAPDQSNQVWVADITYIETRKDWLYLAARSKEKKRVVVPHGFVRENPNPHVRTPAPQFTARNLLLILYGHPDHFLH